MISCCSVCYRTSKQFDRFLRNLLCIFGWCQNRWRLFFTTLSDNSDSINMVEHLPDQLVCYIFSGLDFEVWRPWAKCSGALPLLPNYFPNKMYNIFHSSFLKINKKIFVYFIFMINTIMFVHSTIIGKAKIAKKKNCQRKSCLLIGNVHRNSKRVFFQFIVGTPGL